MRHPCTTDYSALRQAQYTGCLLYTSIWVTNRDGTRHGYQCKGRNGANEYWSIAHLKNSRILMNMKAQLDHNPKNYFTFVSAVPCTMFHDICNRARNSNGNPEDFYKYQIVPSDVGSGGIEVEKAYCEIANAWGLDISLSLIHISHRPLPIRPRLYRPAI